MTSDLFQENERIRNLQAMLRYLSFVWNNTYLRVNVNGEYDDGSRNAIRNYQQNKGLPVTGITDIITWNSIRDDYDKEKTLRETVYIAPIPAEPMYSTNVGERSDAVIILQVILSALRSIYELPRVTISGVYGPETEDAVRIFQTANRLPSTGIADRITWKKLAEEFNSL